eukprot:14880155-Ditylum_brightwellii.AAC.1
MSHRRHLSPTSASDQGGFPLRTVTDESGGTYPLPAYLNFTPGGVLYQGRTSNVSSFSTRSSISPSRQRSRGGRSTSANTSSDNFVNLAQYTTQPNSQQQSPTLSLPTTGPEAI